MKVRSRQPVKIADSACTITLIDSYVHVVRKWQSWNHTYYYILGISPRDLAWLVDQTISQLRVFEYQYYSKIYSLKYSRDIYINNYRQIESVHCN